MKTIVIGDLMLDEFVYGSVQRISPEAPVPILDASRNVFYVGGCGNVALNLSALKMDVIICSSIGQDKNGEIIKNELDKNQIKNFIWFSETPTIVKTRFISDTNKHVLRVDREKKIEVPRGFEDNVMRLVSEYKNDTYAIIISDYNKGTLSNNLKKELVEFGNTNGIKVFVDSKSTQYDSFFGAFLYKPNLSEFSKATGVDVVNVESQQEIIKLEGRKLLDRYGFQNMIVTLGSHGMVLFQKDNINPIWSAPQKVLNIYDVSGAGDTSLATIVAAMSKGYSLQESMTLANNAAGKIIQKPGTSIITYEEVFDDSNQNVFYNISDIASKVESIRKCNNGIKIGFTNGCFDCCHYGHIQSLMQTKNLCDVLVVGINSDSWIKRHKGENRPIQDEKTRVSVISSLKFVDYCIVFDSETACEIVESVRPDVIAKHGYKIADWPEAQIVQSYGGQVVYITKIDGYSTSNIESRIKYGNVS